MPRRCAARGSAGAGTSRAGGTARRAGRRLRRARRWTSCTGSTTAAVGGWTPAGRDVPAPVEALNRAVTELRDGDRRIAAIIHRCRAREQRRVHRDRRGLRADGAGQSPPLGSDRGTAARGPRLAGPDPVVRPTTSDAGSSTIPTTARSSGLSRSASSSRTGRRAGGRDRRRSRRDAAWARHRGGGHARRGPLARTRDLPRCTRGSRARRSAALRGTALDPADDGARRGTSLPAGRRERRVLLLPSRRSRTSPSTPTAPRRSSWTSPTTARCTSRSATTAADSTR